MAKKWKEYRNYFIGFALAAAFWGVLFPQYVFTADVITVQDEQGNDVTEQVLESGANLYYDIGNADSKQLEIKFGLWEWIQGK